MQLSEKMAEELGSRVLLSQPVVKVEQNEAGVNVHTADGQHFQVPHSYYAMLKILTLNAV